MARIELKPNEEFQHYHDGWSTTVLREGKALYKTAQDSKILVVDVPVQTPPLLSHTIQNIGEAACVFDCEHGSGGGEVIC